MENFDVLIVGSGAAGYAAADRLSEYGVKNIALVTEGRFCGTSRNAGSDKQTYYKLSCTETDSPEKMAEDLSFGGSMHKDTAFIEASNSLRCFLHLASLGVPFPEDEYGRFVGYKTDHDSASRGTTSGPLTSKFMTERLEKKVMEDNNVTILDHSLVTKIITENNTAIGVLCLIKLDKSFALAPIKAKRIILATGGAASIYRDSVYPVSQSGSLGLAVDAGCNLQNINEWQYGIASTKVRWNLSGSYQQVIPKYYSIDSNGNEYDFLLDYFENPHEANSAVFLKGYQWPFDSKKITGSSIVDLAVNEQTKLNRKVFMDFRVNPNSYDFDLLSDEAKNYLSSADCVLPTPIKRLQRLNMKAIDFYKSKGIDLYKEPLEIAVCAQHMNGGIQVDTNWETSVKNLFAIGEAAGTFGVYRPGGSALNSTQVGALRAAQKIAKDCISDSPFADDNLFTQAFQKTEAYIDSCLKSKNEMTDFTGLMSEYAGHNRVLEKIKELYENIKAQQAKEFYFIREKTFENIRRLFKYNDVLLSQRALLATLLDVIPTVGSRGGAISTSNGETIPEKTDFREKVIITSGDKVNYLPVRPMPSGSYNFETVWNNQPTYSK